MVPLEYREGEDAFFAGLHWTANPYDEHDNPSGAEWWKRGWGAAQRMPWWAKMLRRVIGF